MANANELATVVDDMMDELETLSALAERLTPRYVMGRLMPRGAAERLMPRRREPPGPPSVFRPAALPPELERLGMSIPAGSRLIGSYARGTLSQIFLDADRSPLHVLRFYEGELHARGWTRTDGGPRGSLWQGDLPFARAVFCRSSSGPSLHLRLERNRGGGTGVWLQLEADPQRSRCGAPPPSAPPPPARPWRLPIPPDARDAGGSGPSQGGGFYQELKTIRYQSIAADLPRRLSLADVEDPFRHDPGLEGVADCYERTLTGAGWR
ncbi:MAG: hypothetical protein JOZ41_02810, partial [Chloroflexi bacterium]|nr:hypothetical protein [Chloroflexota bacterium]